MHSLQAKVEWTICLVIIVQRVHITRHYNKMLNNKIDKQLQLDSEFLIYKAVFVTILTTHILLESPLSWGSPWHASRKAPSPSALGRRRENRSDAFSSAAWRAFPSPKGRPTHEIEQILGQDNTHIGASSNVEESSDVHSVEVAYSKLMSQAEVWMMNSSNKTGTCENGWMADGFDTREK